MLQVNWPVLFMLLQFAVLTGTIFTIWKTIEALVLVECYKFQTGVVITSILIPFCVALFGGLG